MLELIFSSIMFIFFGIMTVSAALLNVPADDASVRNWPLTLLVALMILLAVKVITVWRNLTPEEKKIDWSIFKQKNVQNLIIAFVLMFAYSFALTKLGYLVASFVFCIFMTWVLGLRNPLKMVLISVVITIVIFGIFGIGLGVHLPRGIGIFEQFSKWAEYLV